MRKLSKETSRISIRLPKPVGDWLNEKAVGNGLTLSEQLRHIVIEVKAADELLLKSHFTVKGGVAK